MNIIKILHSNICDPQSPVQEVGMNLRVHPIILIGGCE